MNLESRYIISFFLIIFFFMLDFFTKRWAEKELMEGKKIMNSKLELIYVRNYGVAFNKLSGKKNFISFVNVLLFGYLIYLLQIDLANYFSYSLILAGGLGNFVGRLQKGYVVDFVYFNIKKWPVFNIADFEIFIGISILFFKEFVL